MTRPPLVSLPIRGLYQCPNFLSAVEHDQLLDLIAHETEMSLSASSVNQFIHFGDDLPLWLHPLSDTIERYLLAANNEDFAVDGFRHCEEREPLWNQCFINRYDVHNGIGGGIKSHVDLMKFSDLIVSVSLYAHIAMSFAPIEDRAHDERIDVLLCAGDLLVMCGDGRYKYAHQIHAAATDTITPAMRAQRGARECECRPLPPMSDDQTTIIKRNTRVSITLRHTRLGSDGLATIQRSNTDDKNASRRMDEGEPLWKLI